MFYFQREKKLQRPSYRFLLIPEQKFNGNCICFPGNRFHLVSTELLRPNKASYDSLLLRTFECVGEGSLQALRDHTSVAEINQ